MFDEGRDDEPDDLGPLLPPEDRLWRHPSEVGRTAAPADAAEPTGRRRFPWSVSLLSAVAGATAALGVVLIVGGITTRVVERDVVERVGVQPAGTVPTSFETGGLPEIANSLTPAIARVDLGEDGSASAIVLRDDGVLLTTAHGLGDREEVPVALSDGEVLEAEVVGIDPLTDVAALRLERDPLAPAPVADDAEVAVGDPAIVMTAATGGQTAPSVTVGVVSAVGERLDGVAEQVLHGLIRTDAAVVPAASGGALLDASGAVVGLVTVAGGAATVGYAVPIETAREVVDELLVDGTADHGWLGIEGGDLGATRAAELAVPGGVRVDAVTADSPAEVAGLVDDDVIVSVDGEPVASMSDLVVLLRTHDPGDQVDIGYYRGSEPQHCTATLEPR